MLKPNGFLCLEHLCNQAQRFLTWVEAAFPAICAKTTVGLFLHSSCSSVASQCVELTVNCWLR